MVDVPQAVERMEAFLADQMEAAGVDGYVVGVSGGLDSAVATTLATRAVGSDAVFGLIMPGRPNDEENMADARALCRDLDVAFEELSIQPIVDATDAQLPFDASRLTLGNVRARTRMVLEYAVANEQDRLVLGAGNRSERLLGYVTKYGDEAVDVQPMKDLYKTDVSAVARHVGVDERFIEKTPTAALWEGQTDESELGADYETIDTVLRRVVDAEQSPGRVASETGIDRETVDRLVELWQSSAHKRTQPPGPSLRD
ncbi:NAD+ synthase [Haloplanus sp. C73]|uniref:NAD+ synthase n=1 Tax=Haloplanus sp. C73 TaxID=3421641 RepID=UPI003EBF52F7